MTRVFGFFSVKGGAGKTSLCVAAAAASAASGRSVAVVDADFAGTSIADGLALRAPEIAEGDGLAWRGPSRGWLTRDETLRRRRERSSAEDTLALGIPFVDDLVFGRRRKFDPAAVAWRHDDAPTIRWYPSSPTPGDTARAAQAVFAGSFVDRFDSVLHSIAQALGPDGDLFVDLPPGMFGIATALARLTGDPSDGLERLTPVLVTTPDRNDLYRSVEEFVRLRIAFSRTRWLLNRNRRTTEDVRDDVRQFLGDRWRGVELDLRDVPWSNELARLFHTASLGVTDELAARIRAHVLEDR